MKTQFAHSYSALKQEWQRNINQEGWTHWLMYHLFGFQKNIENLIALPGKLPAPKPTNIGSLKVWYNNYLMSIQPKVTISSSIKPEIINNSRMEKRLIKFYLSSLEGEEERTLKVALNISQESSVREGQLHLLKGGLKRLALVNKELSDLFNLIINKIFYFNCEGRAGGSTVKAIGVIWANLLPSLRLNDFVEFYTHELTHNLLFLDEEFHWHYKDYKLLKLKKNFATSAIRRIPRRLDLAFHSLVVGTEILLLREKTLGHPDNPSLHPMSDTLVKCCSETISSIRSIPHWKSLFRDRGIEIFSKCQEVIGVFTTGSSHFLFNQR